MMTPLRQRMIEDLQLRGYSVGTIDNYVRALRGLALYYGKSPDQIDAGEIRRYFLYLKEKKHIVCSTAMVILCGLKFFDETTLQQVWPQLELLRPRPGHKQPVVLSQEEVYRVPAEVKVEK